MALETKTISARRFLVRGRVQGVGFRWFVEREAHMLQIAGWVRNNPDGAVEILAQGTRDQLAGLHSRLVCLASLARVAWFVAGIRDVMYPFTRRPCAGRHLLSLPPQGK